jgi:hypothetical protein
MIREASPHSCTDDLVNTQHQVCTNADLTAFPRKFKLIEPERRRRVYRYASRRCETASAHSSTSDAWDPNAVVNMPAMHTKD